MLVRTWNLFQGNSDPPQRRGFLREMVELVTRDRPDVVCLQEIPVWALSYLDRWSGMRAVSTVARRPRLPMLGRWLTELHHGLFRSALVGEADAILVGRRYEVDAIQHAVVGTTPLRRVAHGLRLDRRIYVVNCHIDANEVELERARALAGPAPHVILAGDFNLRPPYPLDDFSAPLPESIDQILVHGLPAETPTAWPEDRRRLGRALLSDHAPVELHVE